MNLATASRDGFEPAVAIMLNAGAGPNDPRQYYSARSPLYWAAKEGHCRVMDVLIANGANVDWKERSYPRWTPVHAAAANGQADAIKRLVKAGANINALADDGDTPLIHASLCNRVACVRVLIDAGADPSMRSPKYGSAAEIAAIQGFSGVSSALRPQGGANSALQEVGEPTDHSVGAGAARCMWLCSILSRFITMRMLLTIPFIPIVRLSTSIWPGTFAWLTAPVTLTCT